MAESGWANRSSGAGGSLARSVGRSSGADLAAHGEGEAEGARAGDAALVHAGAGSVNTGHASFMKQGMQAEAGSGDAGKRRR